MDEDEGVFLFVEADESDVEVDDYKDFKIEMVKSTRDNFLCWKDDDY